MSIPSFMQIICPVTNQGLNELQIAFICREMLKVSQSYSYSYVYEMLTFMPGLYFHIIGIGVPP